eukprot:Partr_v1_DN26583_c0_g1_i2_m3423 putative nitrogen permease regulator-like 2 (S. cerevisiae)
MTTAPLIQSIFFADFHPTQGPVVVHCLPPSSASAPASSSSPSAVPPSIVTNNSDNPSSHHLDFHRLIDDISEYIIPKQDLCGHLVTLRHKSVTILGCPMIIEDSKYPRNAFLFNMAFLFDNNSTSPTSTSSSGIHVYENIVYKVALFLRRLEVESEFLSRSDRDSSGRVLSVQPLMYQLLSDLNRYGESHLYLDECNALNLHMLESSSCIDNMDGGYAKSCDHLVPLIVAAVECGGDVDISIHRILKYVNGIYHVKMIALLSGIDIGLVHSVLNELVHHRVIIFVDIFKFGNVYAGTDRILDFLSFHETEVSESLVDRCNEFLQLGPDSNKLSASELVRIYSSFRGSQSVREIMNGELAGLVTSSNSVDMRRLVVFGVAHRLLARKFKYPMLTCGPRDQLTLGMNIPNDILKCLDGRHSIDMICVKYGYAPLELERLLEDAEDSTISFCFKPF